MILWFKSRIFTLRVKSAFFAVFVFPPPASRANVFARLDSARARLTPDGWEALRMQRVDRNVIGGDVVFELREAPVGDRVHFDKLLRRVVARERNMRAALRLLAA